mgnify:CR=1 FL=1
MDNRHWIVIGVALAFAVPLAGLGVYDSLNDPNDATLYVDDPGRDIPANETIAFESLSTAQQQEFERALDSNKGYVSIPRDVNRTAWIEHQGVRYENETYGVGVAV